MFDPIELIATIKIIENDIMHAIWHFKILPIWFNPLQFVMKYPRVKPSAPIKKVDEPTFI